MTPAPPDWVQRLRWTFRILYAVLAVHALWVIATHEWPLVAGLFVALALVYERRAAETLRRIRFQHRQAALE